MFQMEDQVHFDIKSDEEDLESAGKPRISIKQQEIAASQLFQISNKVANGRCEKMDDGKDFYKTAEVGINDKIHGSSKLNYK